MDIGQFAFQVGRASRQSLADEMKRRVMMDRLEKLQQQNPAAVEQMVKPRATPMLPTLRDGLVRRPIGVGGHAFLDPNLAPAPGSPAYYGKDWGVSPEERYNADAGMRFGPAANTPTPNSGTPTDMAMQEAIREKLIGDLDKSADAQRALLAKNSGSASPAIAPATSDSGKSANSKAIASTQKQIEQLEMRANLAATKYDTATEKVYRDAAAKKKAELDFLLAGNASPAKSDETSTQGKAFVNPDNIGVSLAGNTPEMLKAVQSRFGAIDNVQAPAPVTPGPDTQPNVAGPYTPVVPGATKEQAMSPMDARLAMQYPSQPGMGAGVIGPRPAMAATLAGPGTNRGQIGLKEWSPVGQIGMPGGLGSDNAVATGVASNSAPGIAGEMTAAQRVAAQIDADIAAIKSKKKKPEDKK